MKKDGSISIHKRNIQLLAIKMDKAGKGLSSPIITVLFELGEFGVSWK